VGSSFHAVVLFHFLIWQRGVYHRVLRGVPNLDEGHRVGSEEVPDLIDGWGGYPKVPD